MLSLKIPCKKWSSILFNLGIPLSLKRGAAYNLSWSSFSATDYESLPIYAELQTLLHAHQKNLLKISFFERRIRFFKCDFPFAKSKRLIDEKFSGTLIGRRTESCEWWAKKRLLFSLSFAQSSLHNFFFSCSSMKKNWPNHWANDHSMTDLMTFSKIVMLTSAGQFQTLAMFYIFYKEIGFNVLNKVELGEKLCGIKEDDSFILDRLGSRF